ncbi:bcl2-associated agonist of cell death-like [Syngnathus acus]|uniref:bcl2-associated agonist of cell death-like n=1 Tax=Syngnathus acus TaxID=161584 RepID=UPI001885DB50|nr:bcl2-associated agonist of cell death-like [Syngnathus acus]XP_037118685.1 bcl2-associated agonist of cell death-like [Syngnathus acus]
MAAKFSLSDSESEPSEEVDEGDDGQGAAEKRKEEKENLRQGLQLTLPELRTAATSGRIRLNSESLTSAGSRDEEFQPRAEEEAGTPTDGAPFRGRSKSAPPSLWAAKKYGRQLRRMSDEFDSLLDKGELKFKSAGGTSRSIHHSKTWWSYLFSHQETESENNHHDNHAYRTE